MDLTIASLHSIPEGEGRAFQLCDDRVAVFRTRSGAVFAVQAECPHRGGPLSDGLTGGTTVICPLHSWKFDLETGAAVDKECVLRTYAAKVDDYGQIVVSFTQAER
jgi:nitrite reductase (NADH) small subunit